MKSLRTVWSILINYPLIGDGLLTLAIGAAAFFCLRSYWAVQPPPVDPLLAATLVSILIIPLACRRLFASTALLISTTAAVALIVLEIPELNFTGGVSLITVLSAAAYGGSRRNLACIACIVAIIGGLTYRLILSETVVFHFDQLLFIANSYFWNLLVLLGIWWFGNTLRLSREQTLELKERTAQLVREREENARRAIFDERVRIARELHDILAHHVSVMGIQAGAARQVLRQYPEKALNSLSIIETSSREAVAELYGLLDLLRDESQVDPFTAQPGLQQLGKLVADMETSGLHVEVKIQGERREIPQAVDLSAYRIVEEALTNTIKHAGAAKSTVTLAYRQDSLTLDVTDTGVGNTVKEGQTSRGKGLIGMRERVRLLKGEFSAGNAPNGGFSVTARLPLGGYGQ